MRKEDQLIEKAKDEYEAFIDELKLLDKGEIIDKAYEIVAKTDILALIQCVDFSPESLDTLLRLDKPLSTIYSKWLETDSSEMDELRNTIDETVKEMKHLLEPLNARKKMKWNYKSCYLILSLLAGIILVIAFNEIAIIIKGFIYAQVLIYASIHDQNKNNSRQSSRSNIDDWTDKN